MAELKFSFEAKTDLQKIYEYISTELFNEQAASRTIEKILKCIRILEEFPQSGASLSSIIEMESDYRFLVCDNYIAFYRFENDIVYIIRIINGRRDYMKILFENTNNDD